MYLAYVMCGNIVKCFGAAKSIFRFARAAPASPCRSRIKNIRRDRVGHKYQFFGLHKTSSHGTHFDATSVKSFGTYSCFVTLPLFASTINGSSFLPFISFHIGYFPSRRFHTQRNPFFSSILFFPPPIVWWTTHSSHGNTKKTEIHFYNICKMLSFDQLSWRYITNVIAENLRSYWWFVSLKGNQPKHLTLLRNNLK